MHTTLHTNAVQVLPGETRKLLAVSLSLVSLVKGLFVAHFVPKLTLAISSSALGAVWLTDALAEVADADADGVPDAFDTAPDDPRRA